MAHAALAAVIRFARTTMVDFGFGVAAGITIKIYALITPTAVLSAYLTYAQDKDRKWHMRVAIKTGVAIYLIGQLLLIFGHSLFSLFGFTLDAFRIGVGILLFLNAVDLMNDDGAAPPVREDADISVVPLAIPLGMGPATIGALMVMGAASASVGETLMISSCLFVASLCTTGLLCISDTVRRMLHRTGILVMSRLTALLIAAIAAQVIFTGIKAFVAR